MERFRKILCITATSKALEHAVSLAENKQACLTVVDVLQKTTPANLPVEMENECLQKLEKLVDPYRKRVQVQTKVLAGETPLEMTYERMLRECDLVIKEPDSPTFWSRMPSGLDKHLLRKCPCPVWFIKSASLPPTETSWQQSTQGIPAPQKI